MNDHHPRAYVLDDDASVRDRLSARLGAVGLKVQAFGSAQAFLHHRRPEGPGCLLAELQLPGINPTALNWGHAYAQ